MQAIMQVLIYKNKPKLAMIIETRMPLRMRVTTTSSGTEGHYRIIDDAFSPASEHDMNTAFVTDCPECNCI